MMDNDKRKAAEAFIEFHAEQNEDRCLEIEEEIRLTDVEAKEIISKACGIKSTLELKITEKQVHIHKTAGAFDRNKQRNYPKSVDRKNRPSDMTDPPSDRL
jgi:hypothetical protein